MNEMPLKFLVHPFLSRWLREEVELLRRVANVAGEALKEGNHLGLFWGSSGSLHIGALCSQGPNFRAGAVLSPSYVLNCGHADRGSRRKQKLKLDPCEGVLQI